MNRFFKVIADLKKNKAGFVKLAVFCAFVLAGAFLVMKGVSAQNLDPNSIVQGLMSWAIKILVALGEFFIKLTVFCLYFFIQLAKYNNYLDVPTVQLGWTMVRDVANMFFVVVLLMISIGTILGLEQYQWNKTLIKLILAAVFINFSNLICGIFIDIAHVFTITFVNAVAATAGGNLIKMFHLDGMYNLIYNQEFTGEMQFDTRLLVGAIAAFLFAFLAFVTMLAYLVVMIARVVVLWVLIILSPIAFIAQVIPQTQAYAKEWWDRFGKQVMVAPVIVFFLWLAFATAGQGDIATGDMGLAMNPEAGSELMEAGSSGNAETDKLAVSWSSVTTWETMSNFLIPMALLFVGIGIVGKMGVVGGGMVSKATDLFKNVATIATGYAAGRWLAGKGMDMGKSAVGGTLGALKKGAKAVGKDVLLAGGGSAFLRSMRRLDNLRTKNSFIRGIPLIGNKGRIRREKLDSDLEKETKAIKENAVMTSRREENLTWQDKAGRWLYNKTAGKFGERSGIGFGLYASAQSRYNAEEEGIEIQERRKLSAQRRLEERRKKNEAKAAGFIDGDKEMNDIEITAKLEFDKFRAMDEAIKQDADYKKWQGDGNEGSIFDYERITGDTVDKRLAEQDKKQEARAMQIADARFDQEFVKWKKVDGNQDKTEEDFAEERGVSRQAVRENAMLGVKAERDVEKEKEWSQFLGTEVAKDLAKQKKVRYDKLATEVVESDILKDENGNVQPRPYREAVATAIRAIQMRNEIETQRTEKEATIKQSDAAMANTIYGRQLAGRVGAAKAIEEGAKNVLDSIRNTEIKVKWEDAKKELNKLKFEFADNPQKFQQALQDAARKNVFIRAVVAEEEKKETEQELKVARSGVSKSWDEVENVPWEQHYKYQDIMRKMSDKGYGSLSEEEKQFLKERELAGGEVGKDTKAKMIRWAELNDKKESGKMFKVSEIKEFVGLKKELEDEGYLGDSAEKDKKLAILKTLRDSRGWETLSKEDRDFVGSNLFYQDNVPLKETQRMRGTRAETALGAIDSYFKTTKRNSRRFFDANHVLDVFEQEVVAARPSVVAQKNAEKELVIAKRDVEVISRDPKEVKNVVDNLAQQLDEKKDGSVAKRFEEAKTSAEAKADEFKKKVKKDDGTEMNGDAFFEEHRRKIGEKNETVETIEDLIHRINDGERIGKSEIAFLKKNGIDEKLVKDLPALKTELQNKKAAIDGEVEVLRTDANFVVKNQQHKDWLAAEEEKTDIGIDVEKTRSDYATQNAVLARLGQLERSGETTATVAQKVKDREDAVKLADHLAKKAQAPDSAESVMVAEIEERRQEFMDANPYAASVFYEKKAEAIEAETKQGKARLQEQFLGTDIGERFMERINLATVSAQAADAFVDRIKQGNLASIFRDGASEMAQILENARKQGVILKEKDLIVSLRTRGGAAKSAYAEELKKYYASESELDKEKIIDLGSDAVMLDKKGIKEQAAAIKKGVAKGLEKFNGMEREQAEDLAANSIKHLMFKQKKNGKLDSVQETDMMASLTFLVKNGWADDGMSRIYGILEGDQQKMLQGALSGEELEKAKHFQHVFVDQFKWAEKGSDGKIVGVNRSGGDRMNQLTGILTYAGDNDLVMTEDAILNFQATLKKQGKGLGFTETAKEYGKRLSAKGISAKNVMTMGNAELSGLARDLGMVHKTAGEELRSFAKSVLQEGRTIENGVEGFTEKIKSYAAQGEYLTGIKDMGLQTSHIDDVGHTLYDINEGFVHRQTAKDAEKFMHGDWRKVSPDKRMNSLKIHNFAHLDEKTNTASGFSGASLEETYGDVNTELDLRRQDLRNIRCMSKLAADEAGIQENFVDDSGTAHRAALVLGDHRSSMYKKTYAHVNKGDRKKAVVKDMARDWATALVSAPHALLYALGKSAGINYDDAMAGKMNIVVPNPDGNGQRHIGNIHQFMGWIQQTSGDSAQWEKDTKDYFAHDPQQFVDIGGKEQQIISKLNSCRHTSGRRQEDD